MSTYAAQLLTTSTLDYSNTRLAVYSEFISVFFSLRYFLVL